MPGLLRLSSVSADAFSHGKIARYALFQSQAVRCWCVRGWIATMYVTDTWQCAARGRLEISQDLRDSPECLRRTTCRLRSAFGASCYAKSAGRSPKRNCSLRNSLKTQGDAGYFVVFGPSLRPSVDATLKICSRRRSRCGVGYFCRASLMGFLRPLNVCSLVF